MRNAIAINDRYNSIVVHPRTRRRTQIILLKNYNYYYTHTQTN